MANGARMEGIEADLFFFGLDAIRRSLGEDQGRDRGQSRHAPTWIGGIPGFSALATWMMQRQMEKIDIPPIPEFVELLGDSGARLYACRATVDMFGLTMDDFVPPGRGHPQRRRVLREGRGGEDHLHLTSTASGRLCRRPEQSRAEVRSCRARRTGRIRCDRGARSALGSVMVVRASSSRSTGGAPCRQLA